MKIDQFVLDIRDKICIKNTYLMQKQEILNTRIRKGIEITTNLSGKSVTVDYVNSLLASTADAMTQIIEIEEKIAGIDKTIAIMLEAYLSDFVARVDANQQINDAGDIIDPSSFFFVPYKNNPNLVEVSPNDLWFLDVIKRVVHQKNISIIKKEDYYK